jgi:hypothetical protein
MHGKETWVDGGLGMGVLEPLVNGKNRARSGFSSKVTLGARLLFTGTGRSEGWQPFVFAIVQLAVPVKGNRHVFSPGRGFNRPANEISFGPGCEFDGTAERAGHSQFEFSLRTGYGAVFRRLDSDYGSRKGIFVVMDDTSDNPFRTRSLRRNWEPRAKYNSG